MGRRKIEIQPITVSLRPAPLRLGMNSNLAFLSAREEQIRHLSKGASYPSTVYFCLAQPF